jgi:hypothetical protein
MFPILGIMASQISGHLSNPAYESIATANASSSATITFSSIPSTFKHLQIRLSTITSTGTSIQLASNISTGTNDHQLGGDGSAAFSRNSTAGTYGLYVPSDTGIGTGGTSPAVAVIDLLDYQNTNKNKTVRSLYGCDANGSGVVLMTSGFWDSTTAISSLTLTPNSGNFTSGSFALYGIKG